MKARVLLVLALVGLVGTGDAQPRHRKPKKPAPKPAPAAPAPPPEPAPTPEPAPAPAPAPTPPPETAAPGDSAAPGASLPPPAPPPMAPRMAMRSNKAHGGFVSDMDCSACHTPDGWQLSLAAGHSGFDHDRTGFPLRGAHVQTQCNGCHTGTAKPANNCEGCHRDPHEGRMVGQCAECHTSVAWSDTKTLEQHRRTKMPLTGRHATIDCSACHKRQGERVYSDTPSDCYACHAAQYHDPNVHPLHDGSTGLAPFPRDCSLCHQTTAFSPAFTNPMSLPRLGPTATGPVGTSHDMYMVLSTGSHRGAECTACHADQRRMQIVRCDGCHSDVTLRAQHRTPVPARNCLRCHPRGAAR